MSIKGKILSSILTIGLIVLLYLQSSYILFPTGNFFSIVGLLLVTGAIFYLDILLLVVLAGKVIESIYIPILLLLCSVLVYIAVLIFEEYTLEYKVFATVPNAISIILHAMILIWVWRNKTSHAGRDQIRIN